MEKTTVEYEEQLNQETIRCWEEEVKKGKVIEHEKVMNWLRTWGTDEEKEWPE